MAQKSQHKTKNARSSDRAMAPISMAKKLLNTATAWSVLC